MQPVTAALPCCLPVQPCHAPAEHAPGTGPDARARETPAAGAAPPTIPSLTQPAHARGRAVSGGFPGATGKFLGLGPAW